MEFHSQFYNSRGRDKGGRGKKGVVLWNYLCIIRLYDKLNEEYYILNNKRKTREKGDLTLEALKTTKTRDYTGLWIFSRLCIIHELFINNGLTTLNRPLP